MIYAEIAMRDRKILYA